MKVRVVGCGDALGSGGRGNACFLVEARRGVFALDFGATALVDMKRAGLDPGRLDAVLLSHLHGDHFAGLPFLFLHAQYREERRRPLTVLGPPGTSERVRLLMEVLFPGSPAIPWSFPLRIEELGVGATTTILGARVTSAPVIHASGAPATALRLADGERVLAYSGDTRWTETLVEIARGADLFICECDRLAEAPADHLDLATIEQHRARIEARRILLTHMGAALLEHLPVLQAKGYLAAHDGLELGLDEAPRRARRAASG